MLCIFVQKYKQYYEMPPRDRQKGARKIHTNKTRKNIDKSTQ